MYISRIFIKNFRNLRHLDLEIGSGVTCFIGENNSGKTNLFHALRLLLDGNLSAYRRRLQKEDLSSGLSFATPEHVLISIEFADFAGKATEEAVPFTAVLRNGTARLSYRFRPKSIVRQEIEDLDVFDDLRRLNMEDYAWELIAGGDDIVLNDVEWNQDFGVRYSTENLQSGYLVTLMEALRNVEASLAAPRTSPLQQIIDQRRIPEAEQGTLVTHLQTANNNINASTTINEIATNLTTSFADAAGKTFAMGVTLGLGEATFGDIARGLKVLLSGYGLTNLDPSRNGLGLNNLLFISMLQHYFECRVAEGKTAGQLLLVEEPEAHLHPQLQRILLNTLQQKTVQVFITTHSTHITSGVPLDSQIVITCTGGPVSTAVKTTNIPGLEQPDVDDLERYLDATRSSLLFARKVLLVEGPAEQFLIGPMVKTVMGIDLDEKGIAVIPIFGTHFGAYAKLFADGGIAKKCAILTDGDLVPSDADPEVEAEADEDDASPSRQEIDNLRSTHVEIFRCETTFEREITLASNLKMLSRAARSVGSPGTADYLETLSNAAPTTQIARLPTAKDKVLRVAKRFGKARFAQMASKFASETVELPDYLTEAIDWLVADETN